MPSVLLTVARLFPRIWVFRVDYNHNVVTMLSYLTVTHPFSDPGSLCSPRRETCQQLWPRASWSLTCRALLHFPLCGYAFTYRSVYMCCRWHGISSFNQLPKVPVVSFCTTTRLLPHCSPTLMLAPGSGTFLHSPRLWRRRGSQARLAENFQHLMHLLYACLLHLADGFICNNPEVRSCSAKGWTSKFHSIYSFELTMLPIWK